MPNPAIQSLLAGSRTKSLLLDSNLLLLLLTARYDLRLLATFKRVKNFNQDDAVLLAWIVDQFKSIVTTSHVITEVSNLGNSLSSHARYGWFTALAIFSQGTLEQTHPLNSLAMRGEFIRFGITDCALCALTDSYQLLTTDHRLSNYASAAGVNILNFDDLRSMV